MGIADEVGRVCRLPDEALLAGLSRALGSSRGWTALVLAHLAEVEERRLHLIAGHGSMFAYCTARLGMSEDEACRRIEVARLARRYPILYEKLASGEVSLSVAALLKHHLTGDNYAELLAAVAGKRGIQPLLRSMRDYGAAIDDDQLAATGALSYKRVILQSPPASLLGGWSWLPVTGTIMCGSSGPSGTASVPSPLNVNSASPTSSGRRSMSSFHHPIC